MFPADRHDLLNSEVTVEHVDKKGKVVTKTLPNAYKARAYYVAKNKQGYDIRVVKPKQGSKDGQTEKP